MRYSFTHLNSLSFAAQEVAKWFAEWIRRGKGEGEGGRGRARKQTQVTFKMGHEARGPQKWAKNDKGLENWVV